MSKLKNILTNICRFVVALAFVFSGFVKAIDPLGTQYKIQDYLKALGAVDLVPDWITLATSISLSALEFCLGIFLLFAIRRRTTSRLVAAVMVVMTLITVWLVVANPVKDCGCFGDAVILTNGQTLLKNILLLTCAVVTAAWPLRMVRFISRSNQWIVTNYTILFILGCSVYSLYFLPRFDFRPYHIGANIPEGMKIPAGAPQPKFETTFVLQKNGVKKEFTLNDYPDSTWEFVDSKTVQTEPGYVPPIHDFSIERDGEDITDSVLSHKGYTFLLISPHLESADDSNFGDINQLFEYAVAQKVPFYCLTASTEDRIRQWVDNTGAQYPFATTDETTLKTIVRSNPGLLLLKDGTVIGKWSHNQLPQLRAGSGPLSRLEIGRLPDNSVPKKILEVVLIFLLPLFLLAIADRLWAWTRYLKFKKRK